MVPKHSDSLPGFQAKLPRTGHNLSHDLAFTATTGHLLPVFHDLLNPGETVDLKFDFVLRTQPLQAAAMSKIKCYTDYFFVPMQLLWQGWSDWYYNIHDQFSSYFPNQQTLLPLVNFQSLFGEIFVNKNVSSMIGLGGYTIHFGEAFGRNAYRLFDMLGYRADCIAKGVGSPTSGLGSVFPYPILAYNCIYQYFYRLDSREKFNAQAFNVDKYSSSGVIPYTDFMKYCSLQYRPLDDDYFTSIKPSPILDQINQNATPLQTINQWLTRSVVGGNEVLSPASIGNSNTLPDQDYLGNGKVLTQAVFNSAVENQVISGDYVSQNGVDIGTANIRALFANEKLWSVTGRAGKHYDDQTLSHFGFKVPHDVKHEITHVGSDYSEIAVGEVISTSDTLNAGSGASLGEIAGKGYARQSGKSHQFTAPCHGVVMAIFSVLPDFAYENTYLKANKLSDRNDLYTPEFDHLGMQPLFGYECDAALSMSSELVGWQYRYEQWKRRYNRCTSIFSASAGGSLNSWFDSYLPYMTGNGSLPDGVNNGAGYYEMFMSSPTMVNQLFMIQYLTPWSSAYETNPYLIYQNDPFVIGSHIGCKKVSTMSDYSLPRLDV